MSQVITIEVGNRTYSAHTDIIRLKDGRDVYVAQGLFSHHFAVSAVLEADEMERGFHAAVASYKGEVQEANVSEEDALAERQPRLTPEQLAIIAKHLGHDYPLDSYVTCVILNAESTDAFISMIQDPDGRINQIVHRSFRAPNIKESMRFAFGNYDAVGPDDMGRAVTQYGADEERLDINLLGLWVEDFNEYFQWKKLSEAKTFPVVGELLIAADDVRWGDSETMKPQTVGRATLAYLKSEFAELTFTDDAWSTLSSLYLYPTWDGEGRVSWAIEDEDEKPVSIEDFTALAGDTTAFNDHPDHITLIDLIEDGLLDVRGRPGHALADQKDYSDDNDVFYSGVSIREDDKTLLVGDSVLWNVEVRFNHLLLPAYMKFAGDRFPTPMTDEDVSAVLAEAEQAQEEHRAKSLTSPPPGSGKREKSMPVHVLESYVDKYFSQKKFYPRLEKDLVPYFRNLYDRDAVRDTFKELPANKRRGRGNPGTKRTKSASSGSPHLRVIK